MPWKEVSPGRFERAFSGLEDYYQAIGALGAPLNRENYSISSSAKFRINQRGEDVAAALQHAWKAMRYRHPSIAAFPDGGMYVYKVPDAEALDSWMAETFITVSPPRTTDDLLATFTPAKLAKLYYLPHTSEVMVHSSHWRIDGIGYLHLLHRFFEAVADSSLIEFGDEGKNLSPGLDEVMSIPEPWTEEAGQAGQNALMDYSKELPTIGMKTKAGQVPGATQRCRMTLSPEETSAIIAGCKSNGFSVTSCVHAAIVCVAQQKGDSGIPATKYTSLFAWDFRKYCPPPYDGADHPVASYHSGFPGTIRPSTFLDNASQWQKIYSRNPTSKEWGVFDWHAAYIRFGITSLTQTPPPGSTVPTDPSLSSLGDIGSLVKAKYGDTVEVVDIWVGVETLTRQIATHIWTWEGRMSFSACFNENFYDADFVEEYLKNVKEELMKGLGIAAEGN